MKKLLCLIVSLVIMATATNVVFASDVDNKGESSQTYYERISKEYTKFVSQNHPVALDVILRPGNENINISFFEIGFVVKDEFDAKIETVETSNEDIKYNFTDNRCGIYYLPQNGKTMLVEDEDIICSVTMRSPNSNISDFDKNPDPVVFNMFKFYDEKGQEIPQNLFKYSLRRKCLVGDTNMDWTINIADAALIQKFVAVICSEDVIPLYNRNNMQLFDVNKENKPLSGSVSEDPVINVSDATTMQKFVANIEVKEIPIGNEQAEITLKDLI